MKFARSLIATVAIVGSIAAAQPAFANDLNGVWQGAYWGGAQGSQGTLFQATIVDPPGAGLSGSIVETNSFGQEGLPFLLATIQGVVSGQSISFTKTYDGTAGVSHSVTYEGQVQNDRRITGVWTAGELQGSFEMAR